MRDAALAFLDSLDDDQRALAQWAWPSEDERRRWYYTPTDHGGLALSSMTPRQQQLAFALLAAGTSEAGYNTAVTIIGLDNALDRVEGFSPSRRGRERFRDPGLYYLRVFGQPGDDRWSCRFGGHHLSLHWTFVDGRMVSATPSFFGADPADSPLVGGVLMRPLAAYEDLGRELVRALPDAVRWPEAPHDVAGGNRPHVREGDRPMPLLSLFREDFGPQDDPDTPVALGRDGVTLDGALDVARALLDAYADRVPDDMRPELDPSGFRFVWAGGVEKGEPHYYRLADDRWVIEYDNTQRDVNHIHAVLREWDGDFGGDVLSAHLREHEH